MSSEATSYLVVRGRDAALRAASDLLSELGCVALDARPGGELAVYAATESELASWTRRLQDELAQSVAVERVPLDESWKLDWARALEPVQVTPNLRIAPFDAAAEPSPPADTKTLWLEPAFAFGYGEHPTTRMLVAWIESALTTFPGASVFDFGCGTGVLGLAALRLGARQVVGLDISPEAITAAKRNAELNGLASKCRFACAPLSEPGQSFDIVVANVDARTLSQNARELTTRMSQCGRLALSGFLRDDVAELTAAFAAKGLLLDPISESDDWVLLAGKKFGE